MPQTQLNRLRQLALFNIISSSIALGAQLITAGYIIVLLLFRGMLGAVMLNSKTASAGLGSISFLLVVLVIMLGTMALGAYVLLGFWDLMHARISLRAKRATYISLVPGCWSLCGLQIAMAIPILSLLKEIERETTLNPDDTRQIVP